MNILELVSKIRSTGGSITSDGVEIAISIPPGVITAEDQIVLAQNRETLISILSSVQPEEIVSDIAWADDTTDADGALDQGRREWAGIVSGWETWPDVFDEDLEYLIGPLMDDPPTLDQLVARGEWEAIRWRDHLFPVLGEFEEPVDLILWRIHGGLPETPATAELSDAFASSGRSSLRVDSGEGHRAGLQYSAGSKNWTSYESLSFEIFNPGEPFRLTLRIDDGGDCSLPGSRFERSFRLMSGLNEFRVPLSDVRNGPRSRELDLTDVRRLSLYWPLAAPGQTYFLDAPRLQ